MTEIKTCQCPRCCGKGKDGSIDCLLCNGSGNVEDALFSPHFRYSEMVHCYDGIKNDPNQYEIEYLRELCRELEKIRAKVGPLRVTSGFRCSTVDFKVAGHPWDHQLSAHQTGCAADVQPMSQGYTLHDVMNAAGTIQLDQRIIEFGCVHVGLYAPYPINGKKQRNMALVRMENPALVENPHADRFIYASYDGSEKQLSLCK